MQVTFTETNLFFFSAEPHVFDITILSIHKIMIINFVPLFWLRNFF